MTRSFSRGNPRHGDELIALRSGPLRAGTQRVAVACRVIARGRAARLHGVDDEALVDDADARDMRGAGENRVDRARIAAVVRHRAGPVDRHIAGRLGKQLRRAGGERRARVGDRRRAPRTRPRPARLRPAPARRSRRPPARPAGRHASRARVRAPGGTARSACCRCGRSTADAPKSSRRRRRRVPCGSAPRRHPARLARGDCRSTPMHACACGERTNTAWAWPGCGASSTNRPSPRRSASSSTRGSKG